MRRSLPLALAALAVLGTLTACAPAEPPEATPTPTHHATPTPTPTEEALVVGAGDKPPVLLEGDCAAALSPADLLSVTGLEMQLTSSDSDGDVGNAGGLGCSWDAGSSAVRVEILPRAGLDGAEFPADQVPYYFEECDPQWVCSGRAEAEDLWLSASFQYFPGADRAEIDRWTSALADIVFENVRASGSEPWTRDRTGWWSEMDCAALADTMSGLLDAMFAGNTGGYIDPPLPGVLMAAQASNWSSCYLVDGAHTLEVDSAAGQAWVLPSTTEDEPFDTGVPGITAWRDSSVQSMTSASYAMTDGVNRLGANIATDAPWSADDAAIALARAASDWR
ncbi:hypothetical protein [Microbacterium sp. B35-30]|uniref:hypothetical protein n=1 Tax=Microbacterium sp. B35-30 TaxID=1962642 RepID=UPI0013D0B19E|nr:hypothetical protein [Microbacterium sp. B35-30]